MTEGTIHEQLFSLLKEWGHCDLLLDRELSDPLGEQASELVTKQLAFHVNPKKMTMPLDQCLLLARLSINQLPMLDRSIDIAIHQNTKPALPIRSIGGWLFSGDATAQTVANRLQSAIIVRIQNAPDALLRVWDPRVIGHLTRILTPDQWFGLLGPIACWAWIDRSGQLQRLTKPPAPDYAVLSTPLRLSTAQDQAIDRIEYINHLLKTLAQLGHSIAPHRDQELDSLIVAAQSKGHVELTDLLAYGLHALLVSKTFDAIPEVAQAIATAKAEGLGLCAALEPFDDAYWAAHQTPAIA
jgi:hypothetical protein